MTAKGIEHCHLFLPDQNMALNAIDSGTVLTTTPSQSHLLRLDGAHKEAMRVETEAM